ncbi:type II toxin-antitoxin system RelE/ParE family toxin [Mariprofundus ferrooxydans]|nr:type II toxin-antitoxin system RelE/ParE family toxin [Mariprofundus ferrooxydans]
MNNNEMVLLHGIVKKSRATPKADLNIAKTRRDNWFRA